MCVISARYTDLPNLPNHQIYIAGASDVDEPTGTFTTGLT